jgi:hypothetical protein
VAPAPVTALDSINSDARLPTCLLVAHRRANDLQRDMFVGAGVAVDSSAAFAQAIAWKEWPTRSSL